MINIVNSISHYHIMMIIWLDWNKDAWWLQMVVSSIYDHKPTFCQVSQWPLDYIILDSDGWWMMTTVYVDISQEYYDNENLKSIGTSSNIDVMNQSLILWLFWLIGHNYHFHGRMVLSWISRYDECNITIPANMAPVLQMSSE